MERARCNPKSFDGNGLRLSLCHSSDRPKHSGSVFAARCTLSACRLRLVNGYLTQMAPGDTTVGTTPTMTTGPVEVAARMTNWFGVIASGSELSEGAARDLRERGFVVIPGPVAADGPVRRINPKLQIPRESQSPSLKGPNSPGARHVIGSSLPIHRRCFGFNIFTILFM